MVTESIAPAELIDSVASKSSKSSSPKPLKGAMKVIKKLKGRIGLGSNSNADGGVAQPVLQFHTTRGEHVRLSADRSLARRVDSFCKGIAFSARPVRPNDKVYLRVAESSTSWNGVLRIGFTSVNPASFCGSLPKYACPDLTSRPGFWGKALPERYVDVGVVFAFHFTASGDVMLTVDGTDKGVFLSGLDARSPLYVMVDIYGNTTAVQFIDPRGTLNNNPMRNSPARRSTTSLHSSHSSGGVSAIVDHTNRVHHHQHHQHQHQHHHNQQTHHQLMSRPHSEADLLVSMNALNLNRIPSLPLPPIPPAPPAVMQNFPPPPPLRHYRHHAFQPLTLHPRTHGINIRMGSDCRTAVRNDAEFCNGYVMSSRPIVPGESWVVQIVQTESIYVGGMGFGFTTCNPASLSPADLPDDADQLLDRPEYWVISKDVAHGPLLGDEIEFHLSHSGEVTMRRNCGAATLLMHVDVSLPLWAIFDVYGSTRAVRLLGTIVPPANNHSALQSVDQQQQQQQPIYQPVPVRVTPPRAQQPLPPIPVQHQQQQQQQQQSSPQQQQQQQQIYQTIPAHLPPAPVLSSGTASYVETVKQSLQCQSASGSSSECTVCYERSVDCVLYSCGHMCLCYDCALTLYRGGRSSGSTGLCPICRAPIRDVIRAYRS